jgi:Rrf2 family protein
MKLSTKSRYGTRAVLEIARNYGQTPVKRRAIVEKQQVPDSYLENILVALKNAGIIMTKRGAHGGYELQRAPQEITFYDIVHALEGSFAPVECVENREYCDRVESCPTHEVWKDLHEAQKKTLMSFTMHDILQKQNRQNAMNFCI